MKFFKLFLTYLMLFITSNQYAQNNDYYWVGGTGNWTDTNHWATTSGGTEFHTLLPSTTDNVFFDANSFSGPGQVVTVDQSNQVANNVDFTGVLHTPRFTSVSSFKVHGSLTLVESMTWSGGLTFAGTAAGQTITSAGHELGDVTINGVGGAWQLTGPTQINSLYLTAGTLDTQSYDLTLARDMYSSNSNERSLLLGTSTVTLGSPLNVAWDTETTTNMTFDGDQATLIFTEYRDCCGNFFKGGGLTFGDVSFTGSRVGNTPGWDISGDNTFNSLSFSANGVLRGSNTIGTLSLSSNYIYQFGGDQTQTILQGFSADGVVNFPVTLKSTNTSPANVAIPTASVCLDYMVLENIHVINNGKFDAGVNSVNQGGNSGILFDGLCDFPDNSPPVITVLSGLEEWILGQNYSDAGATALDDVDGDITDQIVTDLSGLPNNGTPLDQIGVFQVVYTVSDAAGNQASNTREITVLDVTVPVVELLGDAVVYLEVFSDYIEPGYNATDDYDTNPIITVDGTIDTNTLGGYTLTYTATDQSGNVSNPVYRTIVVRDTTVPEITLIGDAEVSLVKGNTYTDAGATASDNYDGDITANIVHDITNVNTNEVGSYTVTFNVSDSSGNAADQVTRTVIVKAPVVEPSVTIDNNTPGALATYTFKYATHYEIGSVGSNSNIFYLSMPNSFPNFTTLVADGDLLDPYVTVKVNDVVYLCSDILGDVGGIWSSGIQLSVAGATTGIVIPADAIIEIAISGIIYNPSDYTTETLTWKTAKGSGAAIEQYSASITLETLSINDRDASANIISVYPNPTSDFWTVASQKIIKSIEIYDIHGKLMMSTKPQLKTTKIDTKLFERGMYLARINGSKTVQLIKH